MKCITLPNGNRVSIATYTKAWKALKGMPSETIVPGWSMWDNDKASDILREMRRGMHDRINKHIDQSGKRYENDFIPRLKYRVRLGLPYSDLYTR